MAEMTDLMKKIFDEYQKETAKECYEVEMADGVPGLMDNKFGGMPYIPKGESVPIDSHGQTMALFFQINLKDIELPGYPKEGILEIFNSTTLDIDQESAVRLFPEGLEPELDLPEAIYDADTWDPIVGVPTKIAVKKSVAYMPVNDYRANNMIKQLFANHGLNIKNIFDINETLLDEIINVSIKPYVTIGGYADFTQWDIRKPGSDLNECLLKVDCSFDEKIGIADGVLSVLCTTNDLKSKVFDNAIMYWDCT